MRKIELCDTGVYDNSTYYFETQGLLTGFGATDNSIWDRGWEVLEFGIQELH